MYFSSKIKRGSGEQQSVFFLQVHFQFIFGIMSTLYVGLRAKLKKANWTLCYARSKEQRYRIDKPKFISIFSLVRFSNCVWLVDVLCHCKLKSFSIKSSQSHSIVFLSLSPITMRLHIHRQHYFFTYTTYLCAVEVLCSHPQLVQTLIVFSAI